MFVSEPNSDGKKRLTRASFAASIRASWALPRAGPLRFETTASIRDEAGSEENTEAREVGV